MTALNKAFIKAYSPQPQSPAVQSSAAPAVGAADQAPAPAMSAEPKPVAVPLNKLEAAPVSMAEAAFAPALEDAAAPLIVEPEPTSRQAARRIVGHGPSGVPAPHVSFAGGQTSATIAKHRQDRLSPDARKPTKSKIKAAPTRTNPPANKKLPRAKPLPAEPTTAKVHEKKSRLKHLLAKASLAKTALSKQATAKPTPAKKQKPQTPPKRLSAGKPAPAGHQTKLPQKPAAQPTAARPAIKSSAKAPPVAASKTAATGRSAGSPPTSVPRPTFRLDRPAAPIPAASVQPPTIERATRLAVEPANKSRSVAERRKRQTTARNKRAASRELIALVAVDDQLAIAEIIAVENTAAATTAAAVPSIHPPHAPAASAAAVEAAIIEAAVVETPVMEAAAPSASLTPENKPDPVVVHVEIQPAIVAAAEIAAASDHPPVPATAATVDAAHANQTVAHDAVATDSIKIHQTHDSLPASDTSDTIDLLGETDLRPLSTFTAHLHVQDAFQPHLEIEQFLWPLAVTGLTDRSGLALTNFATQLTTQAAAGEKVLVLTGGRREQGRTTIAATVARQVAACGGRPVIVDADCAKPDLARKLGVAADFGWDHVLRGELALDEVLITSLHDRVAIVPWVDPYVGAESLFHPVRAGVHLTMLREHYDLVLIDVGPLTEATSMHLAALTQATRLDGCYVIGEGRPGGAAPLADAVRLARGLGLRVFGQLENYSPLIQDPRRHESRPQDTSNSRRSAA